MNTTPSLTPLEHAILRLAEPETTHLRWWALIVGALGVTSALLLSFTSAADVPVSAHILLGALTFLCLVVGILSLARFTLDGIVLVHHRNVQRQFARIASLRKTAPIATDARPRVQASTTVEAPALHAKALAGSAVGRKHG